VVPKLVFDNGRLDQIHLQKEDACLINAWHGSQDPVSVDNRRGKLAKLIPGDWAGNTLL
jgi:hypothetical protein